MLMQPCNDATCLLHEISFSLFYVHWYALCCPTDSRLHSEPCVLTANDKMKNDILSWPSSTEPSTAEPTPKPNIFQKSMKSYESSKFTLEWNCKITKTMLNSQGQVDTLVFHWVSNGFLVLQLLKSFGRIMKTDDAQSGSLDPHGVKLETDLYRACEVRHVPPRRSSCLSHVNLDSWCIVMAFIAHIRPPRHQSVVAAQGAVQVPNVSVFSSCAARRIGGSGDVKWQTDLSGGFESGLFYYVTSVTSRSAAGMAIRRHTHACREIRKAYRPIEMPNFWCLSTKRLWLHIFTYCRSTQTRAIWFPRCAPWSSTCSSASSPWPALQHGRGDTTGSNHLEEFYLDEFDELSVGH